MAKVICVIGLPGSGKSNLIKKQFAAKEFKVFDDFHSDAVGDNSNFLYSKHLLPFLKALLDGLTPVMSDIDFCDDTKRMKLHTFLKTLDTNLEIEYLFFENNPHQCRINVVERGKKEAGRNVEYEIELIEKYSRVYNPPINTIPVYRVRESL